MQNRWSCGWSRKEAVGVGGGWGRFRLQRGGVDAALWLEPPPPPKLVTVERAGTGAGGCKTGGAAVGVALVIAQRGGWGFKRTLAPDLGLRHTRTSTASQGVPGGGCKLTPFHRRIQGCRSARLRSRVPDADQRLSIAHLDLSSFPREISSYASTLKSLDASHNQLNSLRPLEDFHLLETLVLDSNQIEHNCVMPYLPNLKYGQPRGCIRTAVHRRRWGGAPPGPPIR